jgi:hypothetical protein
VNEKSNTPEKTEQAQSSQTAKPKYEPPKLKKFEKLQKLIVSGE